jgi:hypothetical protein
VGCETEVDCLSGAAADQIFLPARRLLPVIGSSRADRRPTPMLAAAANPV